MKKKILALTLALCASLSAAAIPVSAEVETKSAAIANIDMSWPYIKADNKAATRPSTVTSASIWMISATIICIENF